MTVCCAHRDPSFPAGLMSERQSNAALVLLLPHPLRSAEQFAGAVGIDADAGPTSAQLRVQFVRDKPELLQNFAANLLPQMLQVYNGSVVQQVCSQAPSCVNL